ncbi:sensor histidine kinase [Bacteriovoracales bacterium]|nr:sensor histidine kinase [Bacteriovoracales bacterium]
MRKSSFYLELFILFCFQFSLPSWGDHNPLVLNNEKQFFQLGPHLDILEDKSSKLVINEVENLKNFKPNKKMVANFGFSKSAFWAKFRVENKSNQKTWFLSFNNYQQNDVRFYQKSEKGWKEKRSGDFQPFSNRDVKAKPMVFSIKPGSSSLYFIRVKGVISRISLSLSTPSYFVGEQTREDYILGMFFGLLITMAIYNLFIFISTKNESYLLYVAYVVFIGLVFANIQGYSQRYLFKDFPWMNNNGYIIFVGFAGVFVILFTSSFLELKEKVPRLYILMMVFVFTNILLIIFSFTIPVKFSVLYMNINLLLYTPFIFLCGFLRTRMNYRPSRYFLAGFGVLIFSIIVNTLMIFKIIPSVNFFRQYGVLLGNAFELILISMGLADRFNLIQEKALEKEKEAKEIQQHHAVTLKKEVEIRTFELSQKNEQLKTYNYTVAHDLINPIGVALTYVDYYQSIDPENKDKRENMIQRVREAIEKSISIINGILINFTVDKVDLKRRDLLKIVEMALEHLQLKIEEKKVKINLELRAESIICNDVSMYQVFTNLIGNSIKYSKDENVEIKISSFKNKGEVFVQVSDNGLGIDKNKINSIFNLKSREGAHKVKGLGIGLSIVKNLVKENNGKVEVNSELGKGTTFTLIFPDDAPST